MELLEGHPLNALIPASGMEIGKVADLGGHIANGLKAAHAKGIVHRDIKLRIPTKKITHSELKTIRSSPSDAGKSIVERVIVMGQGKVRY
jgi:serine/threonine protein kinase